MWRLHLSSLYVGHICIIKRPRSLLCRLIHIHAALFPVQEIMNVLNQKYTIQ